MIIISKKNMLHHNCSETNQRLESPSFVYKMKTKFPECQNIEHLCESFCDCLYPIVHLPDDGSLTRWSDVCGVSFIPLRDKGKKNKDDMDNRITTITLCKQKHGQYKGMWNFIGGRFSRPRRCGYKRHKEEYEEEYENLCKRMILRKLFDETLEEIRFILGSSGEITRAFLGTIAIQATEQKSSLLFVFDMPVIDQTTFNKILRKEECLSSHYLPKCFKETTAVQELNTTELEVESNLCVSKFVREGLPRVLDKFRYLLIVNGDICTPVLRMVEVDIGVGKRISCASMIKIEPEPFHGSWKVSPGIFLSNKDAAKVESPFRIHVSPTLIVNFTTSVNTIMTPITRVLKFPVRDSDSPCELEKMATYLNSAVEVIREEVSNGGTTLVHCHMGKHRSASVAAAYLMSTTGCTVESAIRSIRFCTQGKSLDTSSKTFHFANILNNYNR